MSSLDRSGISSAMPSPSDATPRYGATSGSARWIWLPATSPSRSATSFVARATQSTDRDVRLRMNRSSPRRSEVSVAPDQPSFGKASSGTSSRRYRSRSWRREYVIDASTGRRHVVGAVGSAVEVDDVRIRAVAGQHDDERLRVGRVGLDVDLAGGDVDEIAGRTLETVLHAGRAVGVRRDSREDVDRRLTVAVVVDPGPVAGRRRDDRRVEPNGTDGRRGDRDRSLHARVLADRRATIAWGDSDGHRPDGTRAGYHRSVAPWTPDPNRFPRSPLFEAPSPLAQLPRFAAALGGRAEIWIKREDLLPLAFGGNKIRSLEYLVGAALADAADCLVTTGRRWSNHARLTAAAGARAGLEVHLVLSGPPTEPPNPGIALDALLGATIHQVATADRAERSALVERVVADLRAAGRRPCVIATGGGDVTGAVGQVVAGIELVDDGAARGIAFDDLVLPSATGGTQAGLLVGVRTARSATTVHGVAVTPVDELRAAVTSLVTGLSAVPGLAPVPAHDIIIDASQLGDGYGRRTEAADEATRLLARTEGILVDPIYTAKALSGFVALVRSGRLDGRRAVFWHAGGTPGLFEPLDEGGD